MTMRMTDMLQTETPRPLLDDEVFTSFDVVCPDPVVIDATDVQALFMEMTLFNDHLRTEEQQEEIREFEDQLGQGIGWQVASFFQFDASTLGCVAPPFDNFVIEVDVREATMRASAAMGYVLEPRRVADIGKQAVAFASFSRKTWEEEILTPDFLRQNPFIRQAIPNGPDLHEMQAIPFVWVYMITTWRYEPGRGLQGPVSTWFIPLDAEGKVFIDPKHKAKAGAGEGVAAFNSNLLYALAFGPRVHDESDVWLSRQYAMSQGWIAVVPALMALSFMHTPRVTKKAAGYHDLIEGETTGKVARKYLERNFRPLVKWRTLDITPLREAVRTANGGKMPTDLAGLRKALHTVRGYTRTYMPNTYFGRKHDRPITVFTPSHVRGDARQGVVQKEYHLDLRDGSAEVAS